LIHKRASQGSRTDAILALIDGYLSFMPRALAGIFLNGSIVRQMAWQNRNQRTLCDGAGGSASSSMTA
jgi:hypothetical protein